MKVVFLDRDGVINKLVLRPDGNLTSPFNLSEFELLPYVENAIDLLRSLAFRVVVITNQPHYGKEMSHDDHVEIIKYLYSIGVDHYIFAHYPGSSYYKPNNGMIESYFNELTPNDRREGSYLIGDRWKDIVPGINSGLRTIFIGDKYETPEEFQHILPHQYADDLLSAAEEIKELEIIRQLNRIKRYES